MRVLGASRALLVAVSIALWWTARAGLGPSPTWLAGVAGSAVLASAAHLAASGLAFRRGERRVALSASAAVSAGVVLMGIGGLANWGRGVQGYVILTEGEARSLGDGEHTEGIVKGPLLRAGSLGVELALERLEFQAVDAEGFRPVARLHVRRPGAEERIETIDPATPASVERLRLHLGAFGFTPRIVVLKDRRTLFDDSVPFRTLHDAGQLRFEESIELAAERLLLRGEITLEGLDDRMKGHPRLSLTVTKDGRPMGEGSLLPGHFAEIASGYRVGFAGAKRWVEVDVSTRRPAAPIWIGLALLAAGLVTWPIAAWRRW